MTRSIAAHKGGRTCRAPEARIRPQTLQRIRTTMQERGVSFGDLLEEQYGEDAMNYTHTVIFIRGTKRYTVRVRANSDAEARPVAEKAITRKIGSKLASEFRYLSTDKI